MKELAEAVEEEKRQMRPVSKLGGTAKHKKVSPQVTRNGVGVTSGEAWLPPLRSLRLAKRHTHWEKMSKCLQMMMCLKMMMKVMKRIKTWEP